MSNFLPNRIKNLRGWIPETDVDGIDLPKEQVVSETENIVYENGFFRCEKAPIHVPLHAPLPEGYEILDVAFFVHKDRGLTWVYVLWDSINEDNIKCQVVDAVSGLQLVSTEGTVESKPTRIIFTKMSNALKINTNVYVNYPSGKRLYGNYSLDWLENSSPTWLIPDADPTWSLTPRWIGWNVEGAYFYDGYSEDPDYTYFPRLITDSQVDVVNFVDNSQGAYTFSFYSLDNYIQFDAMNALGYITLHPTGYVSDFEIEVILRDGNKADEFNNYIFYQKVTVADKQTNNLIYIRIYDTLPENTKLKINCISPGGGTQVDLGISIYGLEGYVTLISKLSDGQRGVFYDDLEDEPTKINLWDNVILLLPEEAWDSRLDIYEEVPDSDPVETRAGVEFYIAPIQTDIIARAQFDDVVIPDFFVGIRYLSTWECQYESSALGYRYLYLLFNESPITDNVTTLNFNYGLGHTVIVYHEDNDIIGDIIWNEVSYRNRSYYVKKDDRIYLSNLAGNGRLQGDSFPYNEDVQFGYIYDSHIDDIFLDLAVTPLDELSVISNNGALVYAIQSGQTATFRKIKAINGNVGISDARALLKNDTGRPLLEVLIWWDRKGVYVYGGGVGQPKNVVEGVLTNFWRDFHSLSMISAYNPMRNEALFISGDLAIVLDLGTLTWRKIRFSANVVRFLGIIDYMPYLLLENDSVIYLDEANTKCVGGSLVTHYQTNYAIDEKGNFIPLSEMTDKILHELYVSMKKKGVDVGSPIGLLYDIIVDENLVTPSIYFSGQVNFAKVSSPLLVRYRRIKIRLTLSNQDMQVREVGYEYSVKQTHINNIDAGISNNGFGSSFGNDFGVRL